MAEEVVIRFRGEASGLTTPLRAIKTELGGLDGLFARMGQQGRNAYLEAAKGATQLAQTLGTSYKNAREFAASIGLSADAANNAAQKLGQLDKAGASTAEKFRALRSEFGLNKAAFESLNGTYNQNTKAQQGLAQSLNISLAGARNFANGIGLSAEKTTDAIARYRELGGVGATLAEKQRVLTQELGLTTKQLDAIAVAALNTKAGMGALAGITGGVTAGIGAIAQKGVAEFTQFDSQLRQFGVIAEASPAKVALIRAEIEKLGTSTQKTPKEIAELSIELAKAGFTAGQVKDGLGGIVLASQATGEGLARTGEVVGNIINQYGLAAKDTNRIADLLVVTSNKSASGINDLGEALAYTGTAAKESGQSLEDTLLALGQLANAGIKGSSAGTGLAEALRRLKLASANASTELQDLRTKGSKTAVVAFNKIDQAVRGANGQLLPMPQILKGLKSGLEGVSQVDKDLINNALFGVQGGRVIQSLMSSNTEQLSALTDGLNNADEAAKTAGQALSQGPAAGLKQLEAATSVALVKIGELVSGPFSLLIDASQLLVSSFNALPGPIQGIVVAVGGFVGILAAAAAAVAAYNLANGALIVQETIAAAKLVAKTIAQGASTAATIAGAAASRAGAAATAIASTEITRAAIAGKALALVQAVVAGATAAWAAITTGALVPALTAAGAAALRFLVTLGPIALVAGAAIGAIAALQVAFRKSAGAQFAESIDGTTKKLAELQSKADKTIAPKTDSKEIKSLGSNIEDLIKNISQKGLITGIQETFAATEGAIVGSSKKLSDYGNQWGFITSEQRGNQRAQEALEAQSRQLGGTIDSNRQLIEKYGLAQVDAADRDRLGAKGIKEFTDESAKRIKVLEESIKLLDEQSKTQGIPKSQKDAIARDIEALEKSKVALQKRAAALTGDTSALKTSTDATKEAAAAQAALEANLKKVEDIAKKSEKGTLGNDAAVKQLQSIASATGAEVELKKRASEAIVKIRETEQKEIESLLAAGTITESQAIDRLQSIKSKSGDSPASAKAASDAIVKIRQSQINAEIATIQAGQSAIEALREAGNLGEAQAAQELSQLKEAELQKQVEAKKVEIDNAVGSDRDKLIAEEQKLQSEISKVQSAERKRRESERLKDFDEQLTQLEAAFAKGALSEAQFNQRKTQVSIAQADEEIRQKQEAMGRLQSSDREGQEAISAEIAKAQIKRAKAIQDGQLKEVELIKKAATDKVNALEDAELQAQEKIQSIRNQGLISQEQADEDLLKSSLDRIQQEIEAEKAKQAELGAIGGGNEIDDLKAQGIEAIDPATGKAVTSTADPKVEEAVQGEIRASRKKTAELTSALQAKQIQEVERVIAKTTALLTLAERERQNQIARLQADGAIRSEQIEGAKLAASRDRIAAELKLESDRLSKLSKLPASTNPQQEEQRQQQIRASRQRTADLTGSLIENEIAQQERIRQLTIQSLDDQLAAYSRNADAQIQSLSNATQARQRAAEISSIAAAKEIQANESVTKSLERQGALLKAKADLQNAQNAAAQTGTEIAIAAVDAQLQASGGNDINLLQQKSALEAQLAAQKREALNFEQSQARLQLTLDQQQNNLASARAVTEARINELKAKQAILTAQAALQEARITDQKRIQEAQAQLQEAQTLAPGADKDRAIADATAGVTNAQGQATQNQANAQIGISLAQQQAEFAKQSTAEAIAQQSAQQQINTLQNQTLAVQQASELAQFNAAEAARAQAEALERGKAAAEAIANANNGSKAGATEIKPRFAGGPVTPGQIYEMAERGPELITFPGGRSAIAQTRGLYTVPTAGHVHTASQTRRIMSAPTTSNVASNPDRQLLQEMIAVRKAIQSRRQLPPAQITVERGDDRNVERLMRSMIRGAL